MILAEAFRTMSYFLVGLVALYVAIGFLLFLFQSRLIFFPSNQLVGTPADAGLLFEDLFLQTEDGMRLHAWFLPATGSEQCLLYFHGNAGNISHRLETLKLFHRLGLTTLIIDYRGYGKSDGTPSEEGTYMDAKTAWEYLVNDRRFRPDDIILLGRSLGGAIATYLATTVTPRALIIESTFTSIPDRGSELYPFLPVRFLSRIHYNSLERVGSVSCPVLIVHSPEDEIVPYSHGQKLFDSAHEPKEFLQISGGHNDGFFVSAGRYEEGLSRFLAGL